MKNVTVYSRFALITLTVFLLLCVYLNAQTNFVKYGGNPILPLGNPGEWDDAGAAYAHFSFDGTTHHLWYSGSPQEFTYRIGYATSSDGLNWIKDTLNNPVLGLGAPGAFDDTDVWTPWILQESDTLKMWYMGNLSTGGIGYITTTDPTTWTRQRTTPVLTGGGSGAWDNFVFIPVVLHTDSLYQMWYGGRSQQSGLWQTGYATSLDGVNWAKHSNNPVLTVGAVGEWDAVVANVVSVIFENGQYHMWYTGTSGDPYSNWKIGYATSPDGVNWTKHSANPILQPGGGWDAEVAGFPRVIKDGHRYRMWYTGRRLNGAERLGYAEDFSNAAHVDSIWVDSKTVATGFGTIHFEAYIANPHFDRLSARAVILSNDGSVNELVDLTDAGNGVWRGEWVVPADARDYLVGVELNNLSAGYVHNSFDWGVFDEFNSIVTGVNDDTRGNIPVEFALQQNYPNPFNPTTIIEFSLPQSSFVTVKVYNLLGEEVAIVLEAHKPAGQHTVNFDASALASGLYYYTLTAGDFKQSHKMLLLR